MPSADSQERSLETSGQLGQIWTLPNGELIYVENPTPEELALLQSLNASPLDTTSSQGSQVDFADFDIQAIADSLSVQDAYNSALSQVNDNLARVEQEARIRDFASDVEFASQTQPTRFALGNAGITGPAGDYAIRLRELGRQSSQRVADLGILGARDAAAAQRADLYRSLLDQTRGLLPGAQTDALKLVRSVL